VSNEERDRLAGLWRWRRSKEKEGMAGRKRGRRYILSRWWIIQSSLLAA
jgi:hypothetical protein